MALSNIFREPRREITETIVGTVVVAAVLVPDYYFAQWFQLVRGPDNPCPWPMAMIIGLFLFLLLFAIVIIGPIGIHAIGEGICNSLERRGVHLRPRQRKGATHEH